MIFRNSNKYLHAIKTTVSSELDTNYNTKNEKINVDEPQ